MREKKEGTGFSIPVVVARPPSLSSVSTFKEGRKDEGKGNVKEGKKGRKGGYQGRKGGRKEIDQGR
jgi:hypothetical protein